MRSFCAMVIGGVARADAQFIGGSVTGHHYHRSISSERNIDVVGLSTSYSATDTLSILLRESYVPVVVFLKMESWPHSAKRRRYAAAAQSASVTTSLT